MLGVAIRIAQRMGIHNEATYAKVTALEAELRRRLWWSLVIFDHRICEMADYKSTTLLPTWDCRTPHNVNDFDIIPEMKTPPEAHEGPTEALFAIVRSELADFVRHSSYHLDYTNPSLKAIARGAQHRSVPEGGELDALERTIEHKYLRFCNPENPLHSMTIWMTQGHHAKNRLVEHYAKYHESSVHPTETQRDANISHALSMLECDTKLMTSPLTRGFVWLIRYHFPFLAYIHIVQDLKQRLASEHAGKAWEVMSDNYDAHFTNVNKDDNALFELFSRIILQAWKACQRASEHLAQPLELPRMVSDIKQKSKAGESDAEQFKGDVGIILDDFLMPVPVSFGGYGLPYTYPSIPGQVTMEPDGTQLDWTTMNWNS